MAATAKQRTGMNRTTKPASPERGIEFQIIVSQMAAESVPKVKKYMNTHIAYFSLAWRNLVLNFLEPKVMFAKKIAVIRRGAAESTSSKEWGLKGENANRDKITSWTSVGITPSTSAVTPAVKKLVLLFCKFQPVFLLLFYQKIWLFRSKQLSGAFETLFPRLPKSIAEVMFERLQKFAKFLTGGNSKAILKHMTV